MGRTSKDKRDIYYRKAKAIGYRARSAFKLEQIDLQFDLLSSCTNIVDLCAAPGSWSQYMARRMRDLKRESSAKIIAIDLQEMVPIEGVHMLQADITKKSTLEAVMAYFGNIPADIVVSDGAPDVTGLHDFDEYVQAQLVLAALNVATQMLKPGGTFVAKVFRQRETDLLCAQLKIFFSDVVVCKPRCSRTTSIEAFVVCRNFSPAQGYVPCIKSDDNPLNREADKRIIVPFVRAGDSAELDADMSYALDIDIPGMPSNASASSTGTPYISIPPIIPPIEPPYAEAMRRLRRGKQSEKKEST